MQRHRCKSCLKTFNAVTGTPLARLRKKEKWLEYSRAMIDGLSVRKAARKCGIDTTTSFRWRHRFLHGLRDKKDSSLKGIVEADETFRTYAKNWGCFKITNDFKELMDLRHF